MTESSSGLSASDVLAMMNTKEDGVLGGGTGFIILLFIFIWAVFGGNGFGGNTNGTLQTAELYSALGNQDLVNDVRNGNTNILNAINGVNTQVLDNKFVTQLGFQNMQAQMSSCCCETQKTIIEENQKTRDLIQANYVSGLQTALSDAKTALNNAQQTQDLLSTMGRWVGYAGYGSCSYGSGCGCNSTLV